MKDTGKSNKNGFPTGGYLRCLAVGLGMTLTTGLSAQSPSGKNTPKISSRVVTADQPHLYGSLYVEKKGFHLRSGDYVSNDNGKTWNKDPMEPDFTSGLPHGYRRGANPPVLDPKTGKILTIVNSLDVKGLDPSINEPPIAQQTYYLRYRVSKDAGNIWLFGEPMIQVGDFTKDHPFPGVFIGKNSIYVGDRGSIPVFTKKGKILVPVQTTPLGPDGKLWNPGDGHTYTDAVVIIGEWAKDNTITWKMSERVEGDPKKSTRGMIEPSLLEMKDGRLLMVMRGSNAKRGSSEYSLPGYKWASISKDDGNTWTEPEPFTFEDGTPFYSPSSMSTLFKHSSGRCFWVGNMTEKNSEGNLPRWPLVMVELNTKTLQLMKSSLLVLDTFGEEDKSKGRLDISHFSLMEDRETKEIILTYPRSYHAYKSREWVTTRIKVEK